MDTDMDMDMDMDTDTGDMRDMSKGEGMSMVGSHSIPPQWLYPGSTPTQRISPNLLAQYQLSASSVLAQC